MKREWNPAIVHRVCRSNTGLVGISQSQISGRPCLKISWRSRRGKKKSGTVYFGTNGLSYAAAVARAKAIRFAAIAKRMKRERRIVP